VIHTTLLFIGICALLQIPLKVMLGYRRAQTNIQFMEGGDVTVEKTTRHVRSHPLTWGTAISLVGL
jgi:hypothetical protein